jgi:hypothetical protein
VLDPLEGRVGAFDSYPRPPGQTGDETLAGRVSRRVQKTAERDQRQKLPEEQPDRVVEKGYQGHRHRSRKVGDDARPLETHMIHDRPAEDAGHHCREQEGPAGHSHPCGAARGLQDEPWYGHERKDVPGLRDRVGREQGQNRSAPPRPCSAKRIVHFPSPYHSLGDGQGLTADS